MRSAAVLVATCRRPELLARLLGDLGAVVASASPGWQVRVVVCDNDPDGSARSVCDAAASGWLTYVHEPEPGIASARNTLLDAAPDVDAIAFIDDDERPGDGWLAGLLRAMDDFDADVVTGLVALEFERVPPAWLLRAKCFVKQRQATGSRAAWPKTGNVAIRRGALEDPPLRFDARYGLSGGSDTLLFLQMERRGATMIWADDAVVHELVPANRATLGWVLRRSFRIGNTQARFDRDLGGSSLRIPLVRAAKGAAWVASGVLVMLAAVARLDRARGVDALERITWGAGSLAGVVGYRYIEYRRG